MIYIVIAFLWISVCLFLIMGGISFGGGIIECFSKEKYRLKIKQNLSETITPKWELNVVWAIIAFFILLVGFPTIYAHLVSYITIPIALLFSGIFIHIVTFCIRFKQENPTNKILNFAFYSSSLLVPFLIGIIAAASISSAIDPEASNFVDVYIFSWLNWFGLVVGFFTAAICAYLASVFSLFESRNCDQLFVLIRKTRVSVFYVLVTGILVFVIAYFSEIPLLNWIFSKALGIIVIALATFSLLLTNEAINKRSFLNVRYLACFQIIMILVAATYQHNPDIILLKDGSALSLLEESSSPNTIFILGWSLIIINIILQPILFLLSFGNQAFKRK